MTNSNQSDQHALNTGKTTDMKVGFACSLCAMIILLIDLSIPLGIAGGVLYIVIVLCSLKSPEKRFTIMIAAMCTLFVGIGYIGSPSAPENVPAYQVMANRFLAIFVIWITAILALIQRDKTNELHQERLKNLQSAKEAEIQREKLNVLKATMRTVQDITGNFLNGMQLIKLEIDKNKTLSEETVDKLDELIQDTSQRINKLGNIEEIREKRMAGGAIGIDYEQKAKNE